MNNTVVLALTLILAACAGTPERTARVPQEGARAEIGLIETTDLHSNVMSYDYFKLDEDPSLGLERAATLIRQARGEFVNSLTFDAGDTIQGTALADYQALVQRQACTQELAVYKAMDAIGYDAGTIGNHEFNYGLQFLSQVTGTPFDVDGVSTQRCKGPEFPLVLSNVFSARTGKPLYAPWRVLTRTIRVQAADGSTRQATLHIGVLGFTPPLIMQWDKRNLDDKVRVLGVVEAAQKYLPEVKNAGADIVIALVHGGINSAPYSATMENAAWHLAGVPGIDAMLLGHSHDIFPNPRDAKSRYAHLPEVDNERGFVRGVPAVMGNYYGKNIGLIDLSLVVQGGHWRVDRDKTSAQVRTLKTADGYVSPESRIAPLVAAEHAGTIAYVKTPIGHSDFAMSTYFVAAGDTSALQIVNAAQRDYVRKYIQTNLPQYAQIPVLSAASPFKAGFGGPNDYTDVPAGALAINNAADLYLYPNTVTAVKTDGAGIKAWLEKSAGWFNRIDPSKTEPQELVNRKFPTYNFDVIQGGLTYSIDVTQPQGARIGGLRYDGSPVGDGQPFIVVTNNYRASGGGGFPGLDGKNIVVSAPDTNRDVLIAYIRAQGEITRDHFGAERNWNFAKTQTAGPIVFESASGKLPNAQAAGLSGVTLLKNLGDGKSLYAIDLTR
jgi:2',3'-cyclic-nucleotide 2'-phosphodiesterase/3'-nucleotidase